MQPKQNVNLSFLKFICGSSLITVGIFMIVYCTSIFDYVLNMAYSMQPGSFAYNLWRKYPMQISIQAYVWNWTNPHEFYNLSTKPKFVQMGPYVFDEDKEKLDIAWHENNHTISYRQRKTWHFNRAKSVGDLEEKFTSINPTSAAAAYKLRHWSYFMKKGFSYSLSGFSPKIHITKPVGESLFTGYEDPLMRIAKNLPFLIEDEFDFDIGNYFGWFLFLNHSARFHGVFNMATGGGKEDMGQLLKWNHKSALNFRKGHCALVKGSAGEFYPPSVQNSDSLSMFSPELCQTIKLDYDGDVERFGITGRKFIAADSFLDNGTKIPENKCWCDEICQPSGVVNASACRYGAPAFISLPHFYKADPYYSSLVEGMNPVKDKHEFYIIMEPRTRIPLSVAGRLQMSIYVQPVKEIKLFEKVPTVYFPVLWFEQVVDLPSNYRTYVKILLSLPTVTVISGSLAILIGLLFYVHMTYTFLSHKYSRIHSKRLNLGLFEQNAFLASSKKSPEIRRDSFKEIQIFDDLEEEEDEEEEKALM